MVQLLSMVWRKILRKRWVLGIVFGLSLIYFLTSTFKQEEKTIRDRTLLQTRDQEQNIHWKVQFNLGNSSRLGNQCRNSVQGKLLITDDVGYVCERKELLANGCCNINVASTRQYNCESCLPNGCCSVYEYCVSCCLQPNKQHILERFLKRAAVGFQNLFMAVEDHFELCLAKCRTSSQIVSTENPLDGTSHTYPITRVSPATTVTHCAPNNITHQLHHPPPAHDPEPSSQQPEHGTCIQAGGICYTAKERPVTCLCLVTLLHPILHLRQFRCDTSPQQTDSWIVMGLLKYATRTQDANRWGRREPPGSEISEPPELCSHRAALPIMRTHRLANENGLCIRTQRSLTDDDVWRVVLPTSKMAPARSNPSIAQPQ